MRRLILLCLAAGQAAAADTVVATRALRPQTVIAAADVTLAPGAVPGAAERLEEVIGRETKVALYKDRPVLTGEIGAPTLIARNQIVPLVFAAGALTISTEGRALERGGAGDSIRILNMASRTTVRGRIRADGSVLADATP